MPGGGLPLPGMGPMGAPGMKPPGMGAPMGGMGGPLPPPMGMPGMGGPGQTQAKVPPTEIETKDVWELLEKLLSGKDFADDKKSNEGKPSITLKSPGA